jgi:Insertion element 4 transposase N-terminal/Transposase DDE domain
MTQTGMVADGRLTDWISLGVLASAVPRDAVDDAVEAAGRGAKRAGGKLPPHVMVYFAMALALFADDDYEEVAARLSETLRGWDCWDDAWEVPTSGGITQARQRLGCEPLAELFSQVAVPVAEELTRGAFLGPWRLMAIDGFGWDAPATEANIAAFGFAGASAGDSEKAAFPKARVVTISECASHAVVDAAIGGMAGKGAGEQSLARPMLRRLEEDWLLIADRNFYGWDDWCAAADTGAALLWRVKADLRLPVLGLLPDGSCRSVLVSPKVKGKARQQLAGAARRGEDLDEGKARYVRVIEYEVPDREGDGKGELIALITTITDPRQAPAGALAQAYHQRWEHETGNRQLKTYLRGPGRVVRSQSPDMVRQEIYGYLLTHYAISALICKAATEADTGPDRVKFKRTVRILRRRAADPAFSP